MLKLVQLLKFSHIIRVLRPCNSFYYPSQPAITCSKLTIETLEQKCELCSKLTLKTPKRRQWRRFGVFIVNFEHISHLCSSVSIVNFKYQLRNIHRNVIQEV